MVSLEEESTTTTTQEQSSEPERQISVEVAENEDIEGAVEEDEEITEEAAWDEDYQLEKEEEGRNNQESEVSSTEQLLVSKVRQYKILLQMYSTVKYRLPVWRT